MKDYHYRIADNFHAAAWLDHRTHLVPLSSEYIFSVFTSHEGEASSEAQDNETMTELLSHQS